MTIAQQVKSLTEIIVGYRAVIKDIDAVLSITSKKNYKLSVKYLTNISNIFKKLTKDIDVYKLIIGTEGHTAHMNAIVEVKFYTDNQGAEAPDDRLRLYDVRRTMLEDLFEFKKQLLEVAKSL